MTTNTETKTAEKKAPPAEVAYKLDAEGKPIYSTRIAVWASKSGKAILRNRRRVGRKRLTPV